MSTESPQEWLERIEDETSAYAGFLLSQLDTLDDTFDWGARLAQLFADQANQNEKLAGLLITGPEGCGRHTILVNVIGMRCGTDGVVALTGNALVEGMETVSEVRERLSALFQKYWETEPQNLCLIVEDLEDCPYRDFILRFLQTKLCASRCPQVVSEDSAEEYTPAPNLFLVLVQREPTRLPAVLKQLLYHCRVQYPNRARREVFLRGRCKELSDKAPSMDHLLDETEGFSYAELLNLLRNIQMVAPGKNDQISDELMEELLEEQRPAPPTETAKERLFQKLEQTLDSLPDILEKLGQSTGNAPRQSNDFHEETTTQKLSNEEEEKNRIDEMCGEDLTNEYFGKELVAQIYAAHGRENEA